MATKVLIGVSGGIAAYKAVELVRLFKKDGFEVEVVMTKAARRFVTPLTFQAISGRKVLVDGKRGQSTDAMDHIRLADSTHLVVIAPASANLIGRLANGLADDVLTTTLLAYRGPIVIAPAMNDGMFENPFVQRNLKTLREAGIEIIGPEAGEMACGHVGPGRMSEPETIFNFAKKVCAQKSFQSRRDLEGLKILITAGPTVEQLDAVRFMSNGSTGKMGFALAEAARARGAETVLISGPTALEDPEGIKTIHVTSGRQMYDEVMAAHNVDVAILAAAVSDFTFPEVHLQKLHKENIPKNLTWTENPDILASLGKKRRENGQRPRVLIGFSLESAANLVPRALEKLKKKDADLMIANPLDQPHAGFGSDHNQITIVDRKGNIEALKPGHKRELADSILDRAFSLISAP